MAILDKLASNPDDSLKARALKATGRAVYGGIRGVAATAGEGFLRGAVGGTVSSGIIAGLSHKKPEDEDKDLKQIKLFRELQSDLGTQSEILKDIQFDLASTNQIMRDIGVLLLQSNISLSKIADKLPGSLENLVGDAIKGALGGVAGRAAASALGAGAVGAAAAGAAGAAGIAAASNASKAVQATKGLASAAGKRIPLIGGLLSGGMEYAEDGDLLKSIFVGGGSFLGGAAGAVGGSLAGPVGTVAGGIGGSYAGESGGRWLYEKLFGSSDKTEKMAELAKKEEEKEKANKEAAAAEKETINFNSKEIIFKADDIKFTATGSSQQQGLQQTTTSSPPPATSQSNNGGGGQSISANMPVTGGGPPATGASPVSGAVPMAAAAGAAGATAGAAPSSGTGARSASRVTPGDKSLFGESGDIKLPSSVGSKPAAQEPMADLTGGADIAGGGAMMASDKPAATPVVREPMADLTGGMDIAGGGATASGTVAEAMTKKPSKEWTDFKLGPDKPSKPAAKKPKLVAKPAGTNFSADEARVKGLWEAYNRSMQDDGGGRGELFVAADKAQRELDAKKAAAVKAPAAAPAGGKKGAKPKKVDLGDASMYGLSDTAYRDAERAPGYEGEAGKILEVAVKDARIAGGAAPKDVGMNTTRGIGLAAAASMNAHEDRLAEAARAARERQDQEEMYGAQAQGERGKIAQDASLVAAGTQGQSLAQFNQTGGRAAMNIRNANRVNFGDTLNNASIKAEQDMRDALNRATTENITGGSVMPPQVKSDTSKPTNSVDAPYLDPNRMESIFGFGA